MIIYQNEAKWILWVCFQTFGCPSLEHIQPLTLGTVVPVFSLHTKILPFTAVNMDWRACYTFKMFMGIASNLSHIQDG